MSDLDTVCGNPTVQGNRLNIKKYEFYIIKLWIYSFFVKSQVETCVWLQFQYDFIVMIFALDTIP